jgi:hypothetical protein
LPTRADTQSRIPKPTDRHRRNDEQRLDLGSDFVREPDDLDLCCLGRHAGQNAIRIHECHRRLRQDIAPKLVIAALLEPSR